MSRYIFKTLFHSASKKFAELSLLYDSLENRTLKYSDCLTLTEFVSGKLIASGYKKGDIVINYSPLSLESTILCWACLYTGLIFLPVDHNWPSALLEHIFDETLPCLVITDKDRLSTVTSIFNSENIIISGSSEQSVVPSFYNWLETESASCTDKIDEIEPDDPAVILYTSGSTGVPKGVVLSQHALCNSGKLFNEHFDWLSSDVFMNLGDLHFMSGIRNTCITPLFSGSSVVVALTEERNSVMHLFELIHKLNIHHIGVAPTVIRQMNVLFSEIRKKQLAPLKAIFCTGGPLAREQLKLFYDNFNKPVYNYYGLTETAGLCSGHNDRTFTPEDNSLGKTIGAEFILIPEETYDNPDIGELLVKSENLMLGYYKREKETSAVLKNGCFYTGDIVERRKDGCYELLGREKNTIKNIYSELIHLEEIDNALEAYQLIKEACTCSFSPLEEDEKIVAFIVPLDYPENSEKLFINDLKNYMIKHVGKNRVPWCYYFEKTLPRNTMGKIERQKLTEKLNAYIQSEHTRYF